jgi:hypothetical protein
LCLICLLKGRSARRANFKKFAARRRERCACSGVVVYLFLRYNTTVKYTSLLRTADVFSFSPKVLREKERAGEILFLSIQANKQKVFIIVLFQCLLVGGASSIIAERANEGFHFIFTRAETNIARQNQNSQSLSRSAVVGAFVGRCHFINVAGKRAEIF